MKTIVSLGLLILVASMAFGGMANNVSAQDDPTILLKIATQAKEQIGNQISTESSDKIQKLFEEGSQKVTALEVSLSGDDVNSAQEHFLSAMKIFTETSRQLTISDVEPQIKMNYLSSNAKNPLNDLERLQLYVNTLKTIAKNHNATSDFSQSDELFTQARQQIEDNQFVAASETIQKIKEIIVKSNKELREEASKQESQRAKEYAQKYLERVDLLIENAKQQGVTNEIIEKLEISKENLSSADEPSEIIKEIRKILLIKEKFKLTKNDEI